MNMCEVSGSRTVVLMSLTSNTKPLLRVWVVFKDEVSAMAPWHAGIIESLLLTLPACTTSTIHDTGTLYY